MKKYVLLGLAFALMMVSLYLVFIYAPTPVEEAMAMGMRGLIFFLMVPTGWLALLSFSVVFIASIFYLAKKHSRWDVLASSSAEIGIVCTTLALIVGSLWAKSYWGAWWTWEPRLTATLILWFIYLAYLLVRSFAAEETRGARFAAVIGIVGFIDIPIVALSTTIWQRGMHPPPLFITGDMDERLVLPLVVSIIAYTVLYCLLLVVRISAANAELDIKALKETDNLGGA